MIWTTLAAVACLATVSPSPAGAASAPAAPTKFVITGLNAEWSNASVPGSVSLAWTDAATTETGFVVERGGASLNSWTGVLDLRDHRDGQPEATGWQYNHTVAIPAPHDPVVCFRLKAYNDTGSSAWTSHMCTRPDLTITQFVVPPTAEPFKPFNASYTVCNRGFPSTGRYTDRLELHPRDDVLVEPRSGLSPGACFTRHILVANGVPAGNYLLSVRVDDLGEVMEARELDNNDARPIQVV